MSLKDTGKKIAKFSFVTIPLSILGIQHLKMGHAHIKALWSSLFNPVCPKCNKGILLNPDSDSSKTEFHPWTCNHCSFGVLENMDVQSLRTLITHYRNNSIKNRLAELGIAEKSAYARDHQLTSRLFFGMTVFTLVGFFYLIATGSSFLLALNWLSFSFALWVFGMKRSYRCWQIRSGRLFQEGTLWYWFKHERWWV